MKAFAAAALLSIVSLQASATDELHHDCNQPVIPQLQASETVRHFFEKKSKAYKECISKFVDAQKAIYSTTQDPAIALASHGAAEAAINEYNQFQSALNEQNSHTEEGQEEETDKDKKDK